MAVGFPDLVDGRDVRVGDRCGGASLAKEAPPLPLKGCPDPKACQTVYKHYPDRRAGPRRAVERRAFQPMNPTIVTRSIPENRRYSNGRRSTDGR